MGLTLTLAPIEGAAAGDVPAGSAGPLFESLATVWPTSDRPARGRVDPATRSGQDGAVVLPLLGLLWASLTALDVAWRITRLLAFLYLTYGCMCLAPRASLRRWGTATWWRLIQESPESFWQED